MALKSKKKERERERSRWGGWCYYSFNKPLLGTGARCSLVSLRTLGRASPFMPQRERHIKSGSEYDSCSRRAVGNGGATEVTPELHLRQLIACGWFLVPGTEGPWSGRKSEVDEGGALAGSVGQGGQDWDFSRKWGAFAERQQGQEQ